MLLLKHIAREYIRVRVTRRCNGCYEAMSQRDNDAPLLSQRVNAAVVMLCCDLNAFENMFMRVDRSREEDAGNGIMVTRRQSEWRAIRKRDIMLMK